MVMDIINKIRWKLTQYDCDAILIKNPINRFYVLGFNSSAGALLITLDDSWFFTDTRYFEMAQASIRGTQVRLVSDKENESYSSSIKGILNEKHITRLGFEDNRTIYSEYLDLKEKLKVDLKPIGELLDNIRTVKTRDDLDNMIKSQRLTQKVFDEILHIISTDMTEKQLVAEIVYRLMKHGAEDKAFSPIVVSGTKSSMPHGQPDNAKLSPGFLMIDFGAKLDGWCSDMTRTVCIGMPDVEMINIYNIVLKAQEAGIKAVFADVKASEVDEAARSVIKKTGYGEYFGHGFGHGIGLEVHESPRVAPSSKDIIPQGAVISAEPGIYLPGRYGVRIEDVVFVTKDGCENITETTKELIVLKT